MEMHQFNLGLLPLETIFFNFCAAPLHNHDRNKQDNILFLLLKVNTPS